MWSGGETPAPAGATSPSADPKVLREEYDRLGNEGDAQQAVVENVTAALQDAGEELGERRGDVVSAEREEEAARGQARAAEEGVRQAREQAAQYRHTQEGELRGLDPERVRIDADIRLGNWQNQFYWFKYFAQQTQATLEKILEDQNFGGQMLLAWVKASLRMMAVTLGNSGGPAIGLELFTYFKVPELLQNGAPETFARVANEASTLAAREGDIRRRLDDPFYERQVDEKRAKQRRDGARHADARRAVASAKEKERSAAAARDERRAERDEEAERARRIGEKLRAKRAELEAAHANGRTETPGTVGTTGPAPGGGGGGGRRATAGQKRTATDRLGAVALVPTGLSDAEIIQIATMAPATWDKAVVRYNELNSTGKATVGAKLIARLAGVPDAQWEVMKNSLNAGSTPAPP